MKLSSVGIISHLTLIGIAKAEAVLNSNEKKYAVKSTTARNAHGIDVKYHPSKFKQSSKIEM